MNFSTDSAFFPYSGANFSQRSLVKSIACPVRISPSNLTSIPYARSALLVKILDKFHKFRILLGFYPRHIAPRLSPSLSDAVKAQTIRGEFPFSSL